MIDAERILNAARRGMTPALRQDLFGQRGAYLLGRITGLYPARAAGEGFWEPIQPRAARMADFKLIVGVRVGDPEGSSPLPAIERDPVHHLPTQRGARMLAGLSALHGPDVIDLLAWDLAMTRSPRRLTGLAEALGIGAGCIAPDPEHGAVTLCRSLRDWIGALFDLPCLPLGDAEAQQRLIRSFEGGVVCQDLQHGVAVERLLKRDLPKPPPISVRAA